MSRPAQWKRFEVAMSRHANGHFWAIPWQADVAFLGRRAENVATLSRGHGSEIALVETPRPSKISAKRDWL
jgi:hypothetical protein